MLSVCISSDNTSVIHDVSITALFLISASDSKDSLFNQSSFSDQISISSSINKLYLVKSEHFMYKGKKLLTTHTRSPKAFLGALLCFIWSCGIFKSFYT